VDRWARRKEGGAGYKVERVIVQSFSGRLGYGRLGNGSLVHFVMPRCVFQIISIRRLKYDVAV
jgi:hypothetical protein